MEVFHFDETTDTIDSYVLQLKQCVQILACNEGQVMELFKNTPDTIICCLAFKNLEKQWKVPKVLLLLQRNISCREGKGGIHIFQHSKKNFAFHWHMPAQS